MSGEGIKRAVSRGVWPPCRHGDSGTANIAALKDSTTRAAKDGPVWSHCSAPAVRYEGKCGADSAHANHSENELSMKGLNASIVACSCHRKVLNFLKALYREILCELKPNLKKTEIHVVKEW